MSETDARVRLTISGTIAEVRLNRPDKLNALDGAMFEELAATAATLARAHGVRAVVLCGEGRGFCAGLDLASMASVGADGPPLLERSHGPANLYQHVALVWRTLPMPVIAAIHGVCFGGGLQIATGADIRIVAPDARLAIREVKWGIVPDMAGTLLWRGLVRDDLLRELIYTQRELDGAAAVAAGLATQVAADPLAAAHALTATIAARSPDAIRAAKRLANLAMADALDTALRRESEEQARLVRSPNQLAAVGAALSGSAANFSDGAEGAL